MTGTTTRAQRPLPRKGAVTSNKGAPVHNPVPGPKFVQKPWPARIRPSLPPRGKIRSGQGVRGPFALLVNTFDGGTSGNTLTTSPGGNTGGASGNAFDQVVIGSGATDQFDSTHAAHGANSNKIATAGSAAVYNEWSGSLLPATQTWYRLYLYFTANPTNQHRVFAAYSSGVVAASLQVTTGGNLQWKDAGGSTIFTGSTAIPLNAWFRVEGYVIGNASTGQVSLSLYTTPDGTVPVETQASAASQNTAGIITDVRYGVSAAVASVGPYWQDDIGLSETGPLGPSLVPGSGGGSASIAMGQAGILPGTAATPLFMVPPGLCNVTFYNLSAASAWIGTSTAVTSANGMQCHSVPTTFQGFMGSRGAMFYGTTGSTVSTSVATIQFIVVSDF